MLCWPIFGWGNAERSSPCPEHTIASVRPTVARVSSPRHPRDRALAVSPLGFFDHLEAEKVAHLVGGVEVVAVEENPVQVAGVVLKHL